MHVRDAEKPSFLVQQTIIPARPVSVEEQVMHEGRPIGGNFCPPVSSTPGDVSPPLEPRFTDIPSGFRCTDALFQFSRPQHIGSKGGRGCSDSCILSE